MEGGVGVGVEGCVKRLKRLRKVWAAAHYVTAGGVLLDAAIGRSRAAPWFAPVFYSKLLLGHASSALWPDLAPYR